MEWSRDTITFPDFGFVRRLPDWITCRVRPDEVDGNPTLTVVLSDVECGGFRHVDFSLPSGDYSEEDLWTRYIKPGVENLTNSRPDRK